MFKIIYIFLIYAFLGWFMEVTIVSIQKKKLTAR